MTTEVITHTAWYRHIWPWFIIGLLAVTISACIITIHLAVITKERPLDKPYYKVGLSVYERAEHQAPDS